VQGDVVILDVPERRFNDKGKSLHVDAQVLQGNGLRDLVYCIGNRIFEVAKTMKVNEAIDTDLSANPRHFHVYVLDK
jgi:hypothetical protein